jgi:HAD superfamily hydrolase (TIGR01490 family)
VTVKKPLALFDLDHTLLPIDSDYRWGVFTQEIGWTDPVVFKQRNDAFYEHYKAGTLDVHDYVRFATEAIRLRGQAQALRAREQFMREVIAPVIRPAALQLLQAHRDAGEQIVIITATNEFVTAPIAQALGVDELIAVKLARGADGWITGEIDGVPSMRAGKVERMAQWLAQRGLDWDGVETTFYSDSMNDLPLLERADHPVATNPDDQLREIATQRGWRILDLFSEKQ